MLDLRHPDPREFNALLRRAIVELQPALCQPGDPLQGAGVLLMDHLILIAACADPGGAWPDATSRQRMSRCQVFVDNWPLPPRDPLTQAVEGVAVAFIHLQRAPIGADGRVLDEASERSIAAYRAWRPGYDERVRAQVEAAYAARATRIPPARPLPHDPDPASLTEAGRWASEFIAFHTDTAGLGWIAAPTPAQQRAFADAYLTRGLVDHWLRRDPGRVRADLAEAATRMQAALPGVPVHAWQYEQWQHLGVALDHRGLLTALWELRRETWDNARIRPVNWLVCRIRILDLLTHGGAASDLRGLLELSWIGLFADPLPPELAVDLPLMRNWHGLLHALVHGEAAAFASGLAERQELLAAHWRRGGGIAPLSVVDLGGLALLRTARRRGLAVAPQSGPYLDIALD